MTIRIYTKPQCPQCEWTKRRLDARNPPIPYESFDITEDAEAEAYVRAKNPGNQPLPLVETDTGSWWGFRDDKLKGLQP